MASREYSCMLCASCNQWWPQVRNLVTLTMHAFFHSCGRRYESRIATQTETEACQTIAELYPNACGACNPHTCPATMQTARTAFPTHSRLPTQSPVLPRQSSIRTVVPTMMTMTTSGSTASTSFCACYNCDSTIWNTTTVDGMT